jgi:hypothetical protein
MSKITMKSTKQEIMEAYEEAMKKIAESESGKDDPVAAAKAENDKKIIESAQMIVEDNILNPVIIERYENLKTAIEMKNKELQELYGIETKANSLVAMINAYKDKEIELKDKYNARTKELDDEFTKKELILKEEIASLEKSKEDLINKIQNESNELTKSLNKKHKREEEEYEYNLKRSRKVENDRWEDEKAAREKELTEREAAVKADEAELADRTSYIEELEKKVEEIPELIQDAKDKAFAEGKAKADKSNAFEVRALKQQNDYNTQIFDDKVDRLYSEVDSLKAEKTNLQAKLDDAYAQMRELAAETVKSTGGVKILSGQNNTANK